MSAKLSKAAGRNRRTAQSSLTCKSLQKMAAGETEAELLKAYPQLSKADLMAVWEYAARAAAEEMVLAES
jgi:hypothetical protein